MVGVSASFSAAAGLLLAGCGVVGNVASLPPGDLAGLARPASPNTALAGPSGFMPPPDLPTRRYEVPPEQLFAAVQGVIQAQPRMTALAEDRGRLRADHVARSRVFGFPDIVLVQVLGAPEGRSDLVLYSYSLKGRYDFGVNRKRVVALLAALDGALARTGAASR